jgi:small subunit ribosomal protein S8
MMTDPIADMLTRIRNAGRAGHRWADVPLSKLKVQLARLLKENAFVYDYKVLNDGRHGLVRVYLKYHEGEPVIREIRRVSKPGRRVYSRIKDLAPVYNGLGISILSTPQGVMSDSEARAANVGGEVLCMVF